MNAGWWRRNRWGLIGVVPAIAALLALSAQNVYHEWWNGQPREPVPADTAGWYPLLNARMRLVALEPATDLRTYAGERFVPPPDVSIWRARIEFDAGKDSLIGGCDIWAEDETGRTFQDDPEAELAGAADAISAGCVPAVDKNEAGSRYVNATYFALPTGARAVAVRIIIVTRLPRYVRLAPN